MQHGQVALRGRQVSEAVRRYTGGQEPRRTRLVAETGAAEGFGEGRDRQAGVDQDSSGVAEPAEDDRQPGGVVAAGAMVSEWSRAARRSPRGTPVAARPQSPPGSRRCLPTRGPDRRTRPRAGRGGAPSACSSSRSAAYSLRLISIVNRATPSIAAADADQALVESDSTTSSMRGSSQTAAAASTVQEPGNTNSRRKADRSCCGEQVVAPGYRRPQVPVSLRSVPGARGEHRHPTLEPEGELARREHAELGPPPAPARGQSVQPDADVGESARRSGGER